VAASAHPGLIGEAEVFAGTDAYMPETAP
jgi:hypothetical protein